MCYTGGIPAHVSQEHAGTLTVGGPKTGSQFFSHVGAAMSRSIPTVAHPSSALQAAQTKNSQIQTFTAPPRPLYGRIALLRHATPLYEHSFYFTRAGARV